MSHVWIGQCPRISRSDSFKPWKLQSFYLFNWICIQIRTCQVFYFQVLNSSQNIIIYWCVGTGFKTTAKKYFRWFSSWLCLLSLLMQCISRYYGLISEISQSQLLGFRPQAKFETQVHLNYFSFRIIPGRQNCILF